MSMTIKELAEDLGVSKPTVNKAVIEAGLKLSKVGNRFVLSDDQIELVKEQLSQKSQSDESEKTQKSQKSQSDESEKTQKSQKSQSDESEKTQKGIDESLVDLLKSQISVLNEQLTVKDKQISDLTSALISSQEQQRILTEALTAAQALHAGTIQERLSVQSNIRESSSDAAEAVQEEKGQAAPETEQPVRRQSILSKIADRFKRT